MSLLATLFDERRVASNAEASRVLRLRPAFAQGGRAAPERPPLRALLNPDS